MYKITNINIINNNENNFKASFYIDGKSVRLHLSKLHKTNYVYIGSLRIVMNTYGKIMCGDGEVTEHTIYEEELFMKYTADEHVYDKYIAGKILTTWFEADERITTEMFNHIMTSQPVETPVNKEIKGKKNGNKRNSGN